jgi:cell division protein FtsL
MRAAARRVPVERDYAERGAKLGNRPSARPGAAAARRPDGRGGGASAPADLRGRRRRPLAASVVAVAALVLVAALFHVWSRLRVVDLGYRLAAARAAHAQLLEQNRRLSAELAALRAPRRLAETARVRLGLRPPTPDQVIHMPPAPRGPGR